MSGRSLRSFSFLVLAFLLVLSFTGCGDGGGTPAPPPPVAWRGTQQFGTTGSDAGRSIALDSSTNIYITGSTGGSLDGNISSGILDIFLTKFNSTGNKLFTGQFGTTGNDTGYGVAVDSSGNVYVTGSTEGILGASAFGLSDIFLAKFDSSGNLVFIKQFGTTGNDIGYGITLDSSGNVYITGSTEGVLGASAFGLLDVFLAKFDSSGNLVFIKQFGTTGNDIGYGITLDSSGNVYITGSTEGVLGASAFGLLDVFLAKFDSSGNLVFIKQFGTTGNDIGYGITLDSSGNVYITGSTAGVLGASAFGLLDVFLAKLNTSGTLVFIQQFGTTGNDIGYGITLDSSGNVYITGSTAGVLGASAFGLLDVFLAKLNTSGTLVFIQQFGTTGNDIGYGVTLDSSANVFISGSTDGNLDGNISSGLSDIFLVKFNSAGVKQ